MARGRQPDLFTPDVPDAPEPGTSRACTPDTLLEYMHRLGRYPTLEECKATFRGILAPMFCAWELQRQGRWPKFGG